jgi:hypothetical protein
MDGEGVARLRLRAFDVTTRPGYVAGLGLAAELVRELDCKEPRVLREVAALIEQRGGGTPFEIGTAAGFRLIAEDLLDDLDPWDSVHEVLAEAARAEDRELDRRRL